MQETWVRPLGWEDPLEEGVYYCLDRGAQWTTVHRQGHKESDMTEPLSTAHRIKSHNLSVPESSGYDLQKLSFLLFKNILPPFM